MPNLDWDIIDEEFMYELRTPKHNDFKTFEALKNSFDKWKVQLKQEINALCEAGFFYTGKEETDEVTCFYCSKEVFEWEDDNEPWIEHARQSKNCTFFLLSKGRDFIYEIEFNFSSHRNINQKELLKSITHHEDSSFLESSNIKTHPTERKNSSIPQHHNSIPDNLVCKICLVNKMEIAFIPCNHVLSCIQCAMAVDFCGICRNPFNVMKVNVYMNPEQKHDDQLQGFSSECSDNKSNNETICKICCKEEMTVVFMPCRHIYACIKCTIQIREFPLCIKPIHYTMQVYLS